MQSQAADDDARAAQIAQDLATRGWSCTPDFLAPEQVSALRDEARAMWEEGALRAARIGQGATSQVNLEVRGDQIRWLDDAALTDAQRAYTDRLEALRLAINAETFMGLFSWEGHLAVYPEGTFYRRHLDVFAHARERQISTVLYLNDAWHPRDGGALRLYLDGESTETFEDVAPRGGTLACFLSEQIYHEVLPTHAPRLSVTGWFRVRPLSR